MTSPAGCRHPTRPPDAAQAVPPTAPLTPASPATSAPTGFEHEVAWASGPVAGQPGRAAGQAAAQGRPRALGGQPRRRRTRHRRLGGRRGHHHRSVVDRGRARLRPGRHDRIRGGPPRPARRPARRGRRIPVQVPGFRRPGRARHQARRGARPAGQGRHQQRTDLHGEHQALVRRRARVQRRAVAARAGSVERRTQFLGSSRALALVSIKDQALAQAWFDAAIAKTGAKTTSQAYNGATLTVFEPTDGVTFALAMIDGKVAAAGDIASVKAAVDSKGSSGFASEPGPKAALDSVKDDYVGFGYVALRPLLDWSNNLNKAQRIGARWRRDGRHQRHDPQGGPRVDGLLAALREGRLGHGSERTSPGVRDRSDREPQLDDRRARAVRGPLRGDQP